MHSVVNRVEHVKMGGEVHVVGPVRLRITRMVMKIMMVMIVMMPIVMLIANGFDVLDIRLRSWGPFVLVKYRHLVIKNDPKDKTGTTVGSRMRRIIPNAFKTKLTLTFT